MMDNLSIRNRLRSMVFILIHFSCSLIEMILILTLLALQITLTTTETCSFRIAVVFWSFPFLCLSPLSIWLLLHRRDGISCLLALISHFCSTLFSTVILIISFLTLIKQIGSSCSTSNNFFLSINISLIVLAVILKVCLYIEILLLWLLRRYQEEPNILFNDQFQEKNDRILSKQLKTPFNSNPTIKIDFDI